MAQLLSYQQLNVKINQLCAGACPIAEKQALQSRIIFHQQNLNIFLLAALLQIYWEVLINMQMYSYINLFIRNGCQFVEMITDNSIFYNNIQMNARQAQKQNMERISNYQVYRNVENEVPNYGSGTGPFQVKQISPIRKNKLSDIESTNGYNNGNQSEFEQTAKSIQQLKNLFRQHNNCKPYNSITNPSSNNPNPNYPSQTSTNHPTRRGSVANIHDQNYERGRQTNKQACTDKNIAYRSEQQEFLNLETQKRTDDPQSDNIWKNKYQQLYKSYLNLQKKLQAKNRQVHKLQDTINIQAKNIREAQEQNFQLNTRYNGLLEHTQRTRWNQNSNNFQQSSYCSIGNNSNRQTNRFYVEELQRSVENLNRQNKRLSDIVMRNMRNCTQF